MAITKDDVKYIAKLAKLRFDDDEAQVFAGEFENILEQFKTLDKLNLDDVEIERPSVAVVRKDERKKCEIEDLYRNVKVMRDTAIEVPKIIE
ncbi:MAG: Asp-tRNA(Asn)/Glu-tRNA(Gln) amidotransferase subunit GatC [Clostridiales bacterium]|uniref:Asp-tRNA(Asn)/Glu-tRNA(Gln) amidotransferase subunit GatC n=1 Tax=Terrisporobacter sp. TaxID=1965305 RepID=UPI002A497A41|nr:Asp-tRNA(Asn)/Glu-tRNA(Gln) amidotransferase subunit GatC [Terrisporobacter sp.]MCI6459030.1 Asp-tRNA(Asn)/Glu-tRNA(Gln) amidotransferase subunit GatC [Clostridium sp.]MDD5879099.1 Asp-tRNA(Asn)/Glu-tRNA(Gln) amidotransferase subunit GatC [Clostridiales bacterium]MCI7207912.1 Asp-tRNA(Asn)/Glu-tRNA(Gln) amidotransferase subunit GatC [Clostridium sp.]MDD7757514.1 Asp-tRNA(Asn)/Glu-tRNA(Gln) amidotransferase subunit GatC [Clostridiales bacterium]MDY4135854.1 Asp-tRNA(Asn)/Glu-tRNA(Gln) amidot